MSGVAELCVCCAYASRGFAVPIFISAYTWRESAEIIAPLSRLARCIAYAVLPDAVGPSTAIHGGKVRFMIGDSTRILHT